MSFFKPLQPQIWQYLHVTTPAQLVQLFIKSNSEFLNPHCLLFNSFQLQGMKTQIFFFVLSEDDEFLFHQVFPLYKTKGRNYFPEQSSPNSTGISSPVLQLNHPRRGKTNPKLLKAICWNPNPKHRQGDSVPSEIHRTANPELKHTKPQPWN